MTGQATKKGFDIKKIRKDFPLLQTEMRGKPLVFLDSAASSQKPKVVIDAISHYYNNQHANVHRGVYELSQNATDAFELGRERVRDFINAESTDEVIFTRGCTESINLVASCYGKKFLNEGDEVIISAMEHHSNIVPWQMICEEKGATLKVIPLNDKGEIIFEEYEKLLSDRTKIISIVHISNSLGTINPIKDVIDRAHERGIPVLVDGAQAALHTKIDVRELDVDFYTFSSHKVYGPTGIGVLYGKRKWLDAIPPYQGGGEMIKTVSFEKTTYNELPFKFEAGTPDISGAIGLGIALKYVTDLGFDEIAEHERDLLAYGTEKLLAIDGLQIIGTSENKASVISFLIDGTHPYDIGTILDKMGIAVRTGHHCTQPLMDFYQIPGTVRASFAVYTSKDDIDKLVAGVERAAKMLR
ncbi:MAG: cysteine desulfurase/selenocysteine lyase [Saprospiraceae bacterium]|jgi:cysteine desulfurase/selenocysteine lyase|tara:strand:+ start:495 stop:1736 length:1242 start_codon:yes stop_codon:yes gene_type:complete